MEPKLIAKYAGTEYGTVQNWNADCTRFLLLRPSQPGGAFDHFALYSADGVFLRDLPIGASDEPRWSKDYPNRIFYRSGNFLKLYDCGSGHVEEVRQFKEYASISGKGESDISEDGNHFVFCGDDREAFVYTIHRDKKGPTLLVEALESLYITASNSVLVSRGEKIDLYDKRMVFVKQLTSANGHKCVTRDGADDVMVWTNSNERGANPDCPNGVEKVNLRTFERTCLLPLPYSGWGEAVHIAPANGWVLVECYENSDVADNPYKGKLVKVPLDGSAVTILGPHGSIIEKDWEQKWKYLAMPKAGVRRDGGAVMYGSNRDNPQPGKCDVWMVELNDRLSERSTCS
jgi:hypothetical protein